MLESEKSPPLGVRQASKSLFSSLQASEARKLDTRNRRTALEKRSLQRGLIFGAVHFKESLVLRTNEQKKRKYGGKTH